MISPQVECVKEGPVKFTSTSSELHQATSTASTNSIAAATAAAGADCNGGKWEKARMALVRAPTGVAGGQMLVFFSRTSSSKPKAGLLTILITEAREASALEVPDNHEATLVLKTESIEVRYISNLNIWRICLRNYKIVFRHKIDLVMILQF